MPSLRLVPRYRDQGYSDELIGRRRGWVEEVTGSRLATVGRAALDGPSMRGNIENPIGAAQVPLGVAGPLHLRGEHAEGTFFVPLATTEGALVRSYERGMVALTRSGGAEARVLRDENRVAPVFDFATVAEATDFARELPSHLEALRREAESTTRHGRLLRLETRPTGRSVVVELYFETGDAHGMNMIVKASEKASRWIVDRFRPQSHLLMSGESSEKRASGNLLAGGKGKAVTAGARVPAPVLRSVLHVSAPQMAELWQRTVVGHLQAGALGYNGHYANGLTALFIACGQDVANVCNAAVGITSFEAGADGALEASVFLPALTVATVGGGTGLGTGRECLEMLGCAGTGKARKLAEVAAATLLAGELSMAAALASGEFSEAHERYGRNRPERGG